MMTVMLLAALAGAEGIAIQSAPAVGTETAIVVTDGNDAPRVGVTVRVLHRPELAGERELAIGITDARGRVRWVPEQAGVAEVRADNQRERVSIPWAKPPTGALSLVVLLLLAALGAFVFGLLPSARRAT